MITSEDFERLKNIQVAGVMGMATFTSDQRQIREEFNRLKSNFDQLKSSFNADFKTISMGMSGDYEIAISCGSNMVRIGSTIFGSRN